RILFIHLYCCAAYLFVGVRHPPCTPLLPYTTLFRSRIASPARLGAGLSSATSSTVLPMLRRIRFPMCPSLPSRARRWPWWVVRRSEEHTSELQSRENLVCRLLLEKKNTNRHQDVISI